MNKKTIIIGIGSVLRGDDGVGMRVVDALRAENLPEDIKLHGGDISGLDLLKILCGFKKIVVVDAAEMGTPAGTIKVFDSRAIKKSGFRNIVSTHGMSLLETLTLAEKIGLDADITIVGVQPEDASFRLTLTGTVEAKIPDIVRTVRNTVSV